MAGSSVSEYKNWDDPMAMAISNPLILQCIFSNVKKEDSSLKELRLVCSQWNNIIVTLPDPRIQLILNNHKIQGIWEPQTFIDFVKKMNPNLAKNVRLLSRKDLNSDPDTMDGLAVLPDFLHEFQLESVGYMNMIHCIEKFSTKIHTIDLFETYVKIDFVRILHQLLQQYCPNLVNFRLHVDSTWEETDPRNRPSHISNSWRNADFSMLQTNGGQIPTKIKLQIIHVYLFEAQINPPRLTTGPLHDLYESLIRAAPNLIGLRQKLIAFPNCTRLVGLQSFDFKLPLYKYDFATPTGILNVNFTLEGLSRMLKEMSKSLKYLKLTVYHYHCTRISRNNWCNCPGRLQFRMPNMKNLRVFKCSDADIFFGNVNTFGNITTPFGNGNLLQHLEIGRRIGRYSPGIGSFVTEFCSHSFRWNRPISTNLTSLIISGISTLGPLINLKSAFPSLKTLGINKNFGIRNNATDVFGDSMTSCLFAQALDVADVLGLEKLDITQPMPSAFSTFVNVFYHNIPFFETGCLKQLCIVGSGSSMNMAAAEDEQVLIKLNKAFLSMKTMDSVLIINSSINLPAPAAETLFTFIITNSLPVKFKFEE